MKKILVSLVFLLLASCLSSSAHRLEPKRSTATVRQALESMGILACVPDPSAVRCSPDVPTCVVESADLDREIPVADLVFYRCVNRVWNIPADDGSVEAGGLAICDGSPPTGSCESGSLCLGAGDLLYECQRSAWAPSTRWTFRPGVD